MGLKLVVVLGLTILVFGGFWQLRQSWERTVEIGAPQPTEPGREEQILRTFFPEEVAHKKIAHLALSDLPDLEHVPQPRPTLEEVIARFGAPDAVVDEDLAPQGVSERARVHYYGRLGLASRLDGPPEIVWIRLAPKTLVVR